MSKSEQTLLTAAARLAAAGVTPMSSRKMTRMPGATVLFVLPLFCLAAMAARAADVTCPPPAQTDAAVARAVSYLYAQQHDGNWETSPRPTEANPATLAGNPDGGNWGGTTALTTYALLSAGEKPRTPAIRKAVEFLTKVPFGGIYSVGLRCQVWAHVEHTREVKEAAERDHEILLRSIKADGPARGMYWYSLEPPTEYDHSISQYGVLGMWACEDMAMETPSRYWTETDRAWRSHQYSDGGWSYVFQAPGPEEAKHTMAMATAGVATLFLTSEFSHRNEGLGCRPTPPDPNIESGLKWIGEHFADTYVPGTYLKNQEIQYYALFGMERCGVASGRKYFGQTDWFASGANYLLGKQLPAGNWAGRFGPVCDTAFSLLFLAHGRAPVAINKLQYTLGSSTGKNAEAHWNQRSLDARHLVEWMGGVLEEKLNWQIVNLSAPAEELHEAPILLITGDQDLNFSEEDCDKLRLFIQQGGLILGNDDCGNEKFARSFERLGEQLFPSYTFRPLPSNHPIFISEQFPSSKWRTRPQVAGLSNGVRELMLLPKDDLSRAFQVGQETTHPDLYQLADNIVLYSADTTGFREKGDRYTVSADPSVPIQKTVKIARLQYAGNWDPEPGGWSRFASVLHNNAKIGLSVDTVRLGEGKLKGYKLAHLTGTAGLALNDAQRAEIKEFADSGGTLIVDAAGGSTEFAAAAETELQSIFGADAAQGLSAPLPPDQRLYHLPGFEITAVHYRPFARSRIGGSLDVPRICGIVMNHRVVCFYSREDLSGGLVGQPVNGIVGYSPDSATSLMRNIVLYAMNPGQ